MIVNTLKMCTGDAGPEQSLVLLIVYVCMFHTVLKEFKLYTCILLKHIEGFAQIFVHYRTSKTFYIDKYLMAINLSLSRYKLMLCPHS